MKAKAARSGVLEGRELQREQALDSFEDSLFSI